MYKRQEHLVVVVWQLSCWGSYHFLKRDCVADAVPLYQYTHWNWYSFRRPRKDDRLSQPPGVLIQRPTGLELRTLGSQAATLTTKPTPGSIEITELRGLWLLCAKGCQIRNNTTQNLFCFTYSCLALCCLLTSHICYTPDVPITILSNLQLSMETIGGRTNQLSPYPSLSCG